MRNGPEEINRLRLLQAAYERTQRDPAKRRAMGAAIARYVQTVRLLRRGSSDAAIEPISPIEPIDPIR